MANKKSQEKKTTTREIVKKKPDIIVRDMNKLNSSSVMVWNGRWENVKIES